MKNHLHLGILSLILLSVTHLGAQQLEITDATTPPFTPENLITNIFLGDGVEVIDVTYEGDPLAVGYFTEGTNAFGIDRGLIMTSGRASSQGNGPPFGGQGVGSNFASNDVNSNATDADVASLANGVGVNDVCKYSITFIPTADTLRFKYVFASEEYPEYACSSFNDVFGFFISGPGFNGPFQNGGENIALIPGTTTPVAINNIHPANGPGCPPVFDDMYNNNNNMGTQPVYDGYLDVFTAEAIVTPCETYTIKLVIADGGDHIFDSGVFLEAKSFGTGTLDVEAATVSLDGTITEGCSDGILTFTLPTPAEEDYILDYTIIGTAINGVDYVEIPPDLFIAEGDTAISVDVIAIEDGIDEDLESIGIDIQRDICNRDTFWFFIRDNEILPPQLIPDSICQFSATQLDGTLPVPLPDPPSFTSTGSAVVDHIDPTYSSILVAGVQPVTLGPGVIQSVCVNITHKWADDLDLFLISPGGQFIELSTDNGSNCDNYSEVCFSPDAATPIDFNWPGSPCSANIETDFSYATWQPEGVWEDLWDGDFPTNGEWQLLVLDDQAGFNGEIIDWTITFEPLYQIFYEWTPTDGLSCTDCPDPMASPDQTTTYTLTAWDSYGCAVYDSTTITVTPAPDSVDINCTDISPNSITFGWDEVPNAQGYQISVNGGPWMNPSGQLSHDVNNLTLSDTITIEIFALGVECDGPITSVTCQTPECDAPALQVNDQTDVSCPGDTNGTLTASATGGFGGYEFQLGQQINDSGIFTGLPAGEYELIVTDDQNCTNSIIVFIGAPDPMQLDFTGVQDITCFGMNNGMASVTVIGGTPPYQYAWSNGVSDPDNTMCIPGDNQVTVTDFNGCEAIAEIFFEEPELLVLSITEDSATCAGLNTGTAQVEIEGGTEPYSIMWSNGTDTPINPDLLAGTYQVEVMDAAGCVEAAEAVIGEPTAIQATLTPTMLSCFNTMDGMISAAPLGGTPNYQFDWSNGMTGANISSLDPGTYIVTITDANDCMFEDSIAVTAPPEIEIQLAPTNVGCFGENTGSIVAEVSGGSGNYGFLWSNGAGSQNISAVPADEYCLTVSDAQGCQAEMCTDVLQPDELILSTTPTNAGCNGGSEGAVDLEVQGGVGPYSYTWNTGATTQDIMNLTAGNYQVMVIDSNNCVASIDEEVGETDAIVISFQPSPVACFGGNDGAVLTNVTGGSGGFTFTWTGPNGYSSTEQNPDDLTAGTFTVMVEDVNGCSATASVDITEPANGVELVLEPTEMICNQASNGIAVAGAQGGSGGYQFEWGNGQTTPTATNLTAGMYTVTVMDGSGCTADGMVEIEEQEPIVLELDQTGATCHDAQDGNVIIAFAGVGGVPFVLSQLDVQWSNGAQNVPTLSDAQGGQTYSVTITQLDMGCTAEASIVVDNPAEVLASIVNTTDPTCTGSADGTASAMGNGGTAPYSFEWSNGQTTPDATDFPATTISVVVTDMNGCSATATSSLTDPEALSLEFQNNRVSCNGGNDGSSTAIADGGNAPYAYTWSNGGNSSQIADLSAGSYTLLLTDANGCELEETVEITEPQAPLVADFSAEDVSCPGLQDGQINVDVIGGTPPYRYSLNGEAPVGHSTQIALFAGDYDVTVIDDNGCEFLIEDISIMEPEPLWVDLGPDTIVNYGAHIHIHPGLSLDSSQWDMLTFSWSSNNPQNPVLNPDWRLGDFKVYSPASATLIITDENGCTAEDLINIFVVEDREVVVPTGFAPGLGGSSSNDLLHVHGKSRMVDQITLFQVFDRWGELVYEASEFGINDMSIGWDGTFQGEKMPAGVYTWFLEVDFIDETTETYKGHTTLIR